MACTWRLSAAPVPTTAFLTSRVHIEPRRTAGREHAATRLRQLQRGLSVLVDEHLFRRRAVGTVRGDHFGEGRLQMREALRHRRLGIGRHLAVGNMDQPRTLSANHAPTGAAERRIETED